MTNFLNSCSTFQWYFFNGNQWKTLRWSSTIKSFYEKLAQIEKFTARGREFLRVFGWWYVTSESPTFFLWLFGYVIAVWPAINRLNAPTRFLLLSASTPHIYDTRRLHREKSLCRDIRRGRERPPQTSGQQKICLLFLHSHDFYVFRIFILTTHPLF